MPETSETNDAAVVLVEENKVNVNPPKVLIGDRICGDVLRNVGYTTVKIPIAKLQYRYNLRRVVFKRLKKLYQDGLPGEIETQRILPPNPNMIEQYTLGAMLGATFDLTYEEFRVAERLSAKRAALVDQNKPEEDDASQWPARPDIFANCRTRNAFGLVFLAHFNAEHHKKAGLRTASTI